MPKPHHCTLTIAVILALYTCVDLVSAFQPQSSSRTTYSNRPLTLHSSGVDADGKNDRFGSDDVGDGNTPTTRSSLSLSPSASPLSLPFWRAPNAEISRRAALVSSAVLAAGASPAFAQDLAEKVAALYSDNADIANSNGAPEKHIPAAKVSKDERTNRVKRVEVTVPHVMDPDKPHFIEYMWLVEEKTGEVVVAKKLEATDPSPPTLNCVAPKGVELRPMCWCNLHGLWKGETFKV